VKETIDKGAQWQKIILIGIVIFIIVAVIIGLLIGFQSLKKFIIYVFVTLLILFVLFLAAYLFYILFIRKTFKDIPAQFRKKLEVASKLSENNMLGDLYLSGDSKHNRLKYGKYFYLRLNLPKINKVPVTEEIEAMEGKNKVKHIVPKLDSMGNQVFQETTEWLPIDTFIVQRKGFFSRLFNDPIFILTYPQDHDYSSIFNDVVINGFNIVPLDNYFYTIDRRMLDTDLIKAMSNSYIKEVIYEVMRELDKLVKTTMNLDQSFQKEKERQTEFELPQMPMQGR
jgi:hypothetical protein